MPVHENETPLAEAENRDLERDGLILKLHQEDVVVTKRLIERSVVRIATETRLVEKVVDEALVHERVEIEHKPVGRYVDAVPPVREEGDLTVMPVIEEVVVVERRLWLKEEVHIRRVRTTEQHRETIQLREQEAVITRTPATADATGSPTSRPEIMLQSNPKEIPK